MGKKSDLSPECQKFVKKLFAFFSKEKATKKPIVSFDRVYQRTSKALGVSYTSVHRIMNGKRPCKSNRPKERAKILDDFDHCVIKRTIHGLYSRKIAPTRTVSIIHQEIKDSIKISKSKLTLTLKVKGFVAKYNTTFRLKDVKELTYAAFGKNTKDVWTKAEEHVVKIEKEYCKENCIDISVIEPIIIDICDDDSDDDTG